jgi:hypothetical protein
MKRYPILFALVLGACSQSPDQPVANNDAGPLPPAENGTADPFQNAGNAALPDDRTPLEEPSGPIDPKSAEAAGQVVQSFGALIEQKKWAEAEALWGDRATATRFTADLKRNRESHIEIGKPGDPEGAAGSIYVTMPIVFYGKNASGADFRRGADVILRRVNDVDGSTEAQRRWHIERIELKA